MSWLETITQGVYSKHRLPDSTSSDSDLEGLGWGPGIYILNKHLKKKNKKTTNKHLGKSCDLRSLENTIPYDFTYYLSIFHPDLFLSY